MKVFGPDSKNNWLRFLEHFEINKPDIFYTPYYYQTWEDYEDAEPICFTFGINGTFFLYPFFKKEISDPKLVGRFFDIFSAYGYGGVLCSRPEPEREAVELFNAEFNSWCSRQNIVAEFIRCNPLFPDKIRDANYDIVRNNVYVKPHNDYKITSKNTLQNINKAIASGIKTEVDEKLVGLEDFIRLYGKTAERLNMSSFYKFPGSYFYRTKEILLPQTRLIHARYHENIIASMLLFEFNGYLNCHLAASDFDYKDLRMNDILFKAVIDYGIMQKSDVICLGGGTSTDENDGLFRFKSKFSDWAEPVYVGRKILRQDVYEQLISNWEQANPEKAERFKHIFLRYRF